MANSPNILLIMSDQHSPHVLGCAGDEVVRTPTLDRLAERGIRFTNTYCGNPLCVPSRMTFLTSRHSSDIRVWTNRCRLQSDIPTFVHHLVNAGYETVLCGRMHFTGPDQRHGFERRIIGDVHPKLEHIPLSTTGQTADGVKVAGPGHTAYSRYDEEVTRVCCQFLESRDAQPGDRPFFMTVGYVLPHCPFIAPKRLFDEYFERVNLPELPPGYHDSLHPFMRSWRRHRKVDELMDEQVRIARAAYYGLVTLMDERIGKIMSTLAQTHFGEDTLVIYASDHGEMAGEHRMWWKSSFYEGSVGVPLIFSCPDQLAEGRVITDVTSLLDIGPTLIELAGGEPMSSVRGRSLKGFLTGDGSVSGWPDSAFAELGGLQSDAPGRMIRRGPWKLNDYHGYDRPQLFNLESDPGEWNDLGGDDSYADVRDELLAEVRAGWSGEEVLRTLEMAERDRQIFEKFSTNARISAGDPPDRWTAPDGCNIFPEK
ncbi:MAG: sulfatase-like hydrolase/transferase [Candidatus Poribacteria bacterium]|nr:sulfatase-like hydrolase/transferase [Candidatus Poribacteria bacterium]